MLLTNEELARECWAMHSPEDQSCSNVQERRGGGGTEGPYVQS